MFSGFAQTYCEDSGLARPLHSCVETVVSAFELSNLDLLLLVAGNVKG